MTFSQTTTIEKSWLQSQSRIKADRKVYWTFCSLSVFLSICALSATFVTTILDLPKSHKYCLAFQDDFQGDSIDHTIWNHEVQTGGWGTGEFEWTTDSTNNSFVKDGKLFIVPTLTSDALGEEAIINGYSLNLTAMNTCTSSNKSDIYCAAQSNSSTGMILPPVQSARLTTRLSGKGIRFGKIEVKAKMPTGDWLWPAVWMMPTREIYGPWPASGEIDIFEGKGNKAEYRHDRTSNTMSSTLHWGPIADLDQYLRSHGTLTLLRQFWNSKSRTFGMTWDENGIVTWQKSRAFEVMNFQFPRKGLWSIGDFPTTLSNGSFLNNPWTLSASSNVTNAAPFDQDFYLILSVAVGSTNSYFQDADSTKGKPWSDAAINPMRDFWLAKNQWLPTWPLNVEDRAMVIESVKVWQQC